MNYVDLLAEYRRILEENPGKALLIGNDTAAVLMDGQLFGCYHSAVTGLALGEAFDFDASAWDDEAGCWDCDPTGGLETTDAINRPVLVDLVPAAGEQSHD